MLVGHLTACVSNRSQHNMNRTEAGDTKVNLDATTETRLFGRGLSHSIFAKIAILALLVLVAGFATAAKHSWYYSESHPAHYLSISSKMKVAHAGGVFVRTNTEPVAKIASPQQERKSTRRDRPETPPIRQISVRVSLQHRSPPFLLS